jgi:hypothetical protein
LPPAAWISRIALEFERLALGASGAFAARYSGSLSERYDSLPNGDEQAHAAIHDSFDDHGGFSLPGYC